MDDQSFDTLFNEEIEDELSIFEDQITFKMIMENEEVLERQKEDEEKQRRMKKQQERNRKLDEENNRHHQELLRKKEKLSVYKDMINELLNVMMIKDPEKIIETYQNM